jgi:ferrous iron transport protein A
VTLHQVPPGDAVRLTDLTDHPTKRRLRELGLRPGVQVTVLRRTSGGGRVLALGTTRLAVDKTTATQLVVEPLPLTPRP